ncbi:MAG: hypothetical protein IPM61_02210 [Chlorobi bacterium]|nr:MAG: hypothetical protein UZ07_CHB004003310 [Chlorobi bacterium OLB7]MBK8910120.1 hypothetical protein [Chlorobiota bacterium]MBX7217795.1 hypothetical protein [Candidatus Kapabacteria bacterium]
MQQTRFDSGAAVGSGNQPEEKFVPKGAITFFLLLLVAYTLMWFSIYFDMLSRR